MELALYLVEHTFLTFRKELRDQGIAHLPAMTGQANFMKPRRIKPTGFLALAGVPITKLSTEVGAHLHAMRFGIADILGELLCPLTRLARALLERMRPGKGLFARKRRTATGAAASERPGAVCVGIADACAVGDSGVVADALRRRIAIISAARLIRVVTEAVALDPGLGDLSTNRGKSTNGTTEQSAAARRWSVGACPFRSRTGTATATPADAGSDRATNSVDCLSATIVAVGKPPRLRNGALILEAGRCALTVTDAPVDRRSMLRG